MTRSKFNSTEWQLIRDGPEWVMAALAAADGNVALMTRAKESGDYKNALKEYSTTSSFVREVLADKGKPAKELKDATLSDAEQAISEINALLGSKLTLEEANPYRDLLIGIADTVAGAAGEGFLGLGEKVSKKEAKAVEKIKKALKPPVTAKPAAKPGTKPMQKTAARPPTRTTAVPGKIQRSLQPRTKGTTGARPLGSASRAATEYMAEHTVVSGETLSHISLKYYNSAIKPKYMVIYEENKDVIGDDPNRIIPGMVLKIPKL
ncbi:MAG TPA: LysM peptidoglycan-binding domain-containing protein [Anaerolineales bacterium]|nr:LysM peptidoglycan-binding domain-containing protein [Anaerolineales bacterium]